MSDIENTIRIALQAHKGQKDRERIVKYKKAMEFLEEDKKYKVGKE